MVGTLACADSRRLSSEYMQSLVWNSESVGLTVTCVSRFEAARSDFRLAVDKSRVDRTPLAAVA